MSTPTKQDLVRDGQAIIKQIGQWFADSEAVLDDVARKQFSNAVIDEVFQGQLATMDQQEVLERWGK